MNDLSASNAINCTAGTSPPRAINFTAVDREAIEINCTGWTVGNDTRRSDTKTERHVVPGCATDDPSLAPFIEAAHAVNTRRAYQGDLDHFRAWGGTIPSSEQMVARYLADHAQSLAVGTLRRRLSAIALAHYTTGIENPCNSPLVRLVLRGIARQRGSAVRQVRPLLADQVLEIVGQLGDTPRDIRDKALLLLGFAGAFRRSELVALNIEDLTMQDAGLLVTLRRSKTDPTGHGRTIAVPSGGGTGCVVTAIYEWMNVIGHNIGPLFRRIRKGGVVLSVRLSDRAVAEIIKTNARRIGLNPDDYSGHSLRAGLVTSAAQAGTDYATIRDQSGHRSDQTLGAYVRRSEAFSHNAASQALGGVARSKLFIHN